MEMKIVTFGETMMRLSSINNNRLQQSKNFEVSFAGSEANVAVDLAIWGKETSFITSLPNNELGESVLNDLNSFNVNTKNILLSDKQRLGLIFLEKGANQLGSKVIYDRKDSAFVNQEFTFDFLSGALDNYSWLHWSGITPGLGSNSISNIEKVLQVASNKGLNVSCDLNYRSTLWDNGVKPHEIMPDLLSHSTIIMGNEEDASIMLNLDSTTINVQKGEIKTESYQPICNEIFQKYPKCEIICFSIRESKSADHNDWSAILATRNSFFVSAKYEIKSIVDRVGAGDSFSAGIIYGLTTFNNDYQKILEFATAASCLKHSIKGDYCQCSTKEIFKLMEGDASGRITR